MQVRTLKIVAGAMLLCTSIYIVLLLQRIPAALRTSEDNTGDYQPLNTPVINKTYSQQASAPQNKARPSGADPRAHATSEVYNSEGNTGDYQPVNTPVNNKLYSQQASAPQNKAKPSGVGADPRAHATSEVYNSEGNTGNYQPVNTSMVIKTYSQQASAPQNKAKPSGIGADLRAHCCGLSGGITLEELCGSEGVIKLTALAEEAKEQNCTCLDFFYCKLVVVTAFSNNHFIEAVDMIASVQHFLPSTKLIVYDLGLSTPQKGNLSNYCNVEFREFQFMKYPPHVNVSNLKQYAWKPLIVGEVAQQYEVFMWGDASARLIAPFTENILPLLWKFPFVAGSTLSVPIISLTHDGMISYLNFTLSREQMAHFPHIEANCWVMWANSLMRKRILQPWADCAMHEECIAPPGASLYGCDFRVQTKNGTYIGCHRYDQSALDLLLVREFGIEVWRSAVHNIKRTVFRVQRRPTHLYTVKQCPESHSNNLANATRL